MTQAIGIVAAPGTGKSSAIPLVAQSLSGILVRPVVSLDNENFGLQPRARVEVAKAMGYDNPDEPEFRATIGRAILLNTVASIGSHMRQYEPHGLGLVHIPDKDPAVQIEGVPVFEKFQQQYRAVGVDIIAFVGIYVGGDDDEYVAAMLKRFGSRKDLPYQQELDAPKRVREDLLFRRDCVKKMADHSHQVIELPPLGTAVETADLLTRELTAFLS